MESFSQALPRVAGRRAFAACSLRAVAVLVAFGTLFATVGVGHASARDPLVGKKFSNAASWISQRNGTPVVATVSGSQLPLDDCVVTSWSRGGFLNSSGKKDRRNEYYIHLNCNNTVATAGHPGNSVVTPEGAQRKKELKYAASLNRRPEQCFKDDTTLKNCRNFCKNTGLCEFKI